MAEFKSTTIIPLNGSNYPTWKVQCRMALMRDGVWSIVNGTEKSPASAEGASRVKFIARRDKALATIVLAVDPSLLYLIGDPEDPVAVWKKLEEQFQRKTWANKLLLRRKLHALRLKEKESVQDHIKTMIEIFNELAIIGENLSDEDRVVYLLASLPESYNTLVTALEASSDVPEMEVVTERLLNEERKQKERSTVNSNGEEAFTVKRRGRFHGSIKCYRCHKFGHIQQNCTAAERTIEQGHSGSSVNTKSWKGHKKPAANRKHTINSTEVSHQRELSDSEDSTDCGLVTNHVMSAKSTKNAARKRDYWIIDSGATCHICNDETLFTNLTPMRKPQSIILGDGHQLEAKSYGMVILAMQDGVEVKHLTIENVLFVPSLAYNLLSVSKLTETGSRMTFFENQCILKDSKDRVLAIACRNGNLYHLMNSTSQLNITCEKNYVELWHRRFGHLGEGSLQKLARNLMVEGFAYDTTNSLTGPCESCAAGKLHKVPFPRSERRRAKDPLEIVHSDVCGKLRNKSLGGAEYFLTFIDDKTHYTWVYMLKRKYEVFQKFREWKEMVERESGRKVKILRTDNGGEYTSNEFQAHLRKHGIKHEMTIPKTPEQNGVAERMNRTLVESTRTMIFDANLPKRFWAETLSTAVYLRNRSPTKATADLTPFEAWYGYKPDVSHLRVFGCVAYSHIEKDERSKLDPKSRKCILLGYGTNVKGYRLYDLEKQQICQSRNVWFDESIIGFNKHQLSETVEPANVQSEEAEDTNSETEEENESDNPEQVPAVRQLPPRIRREPERYGVWINSIDTSDFEPTTFKDALSSSDREKWQEAMGKEMQLIHNNDVWDLVSLPSNRDAIGCKWVFKKKIGSNGSIERYKARLVAQGYAQQYGLDYDETFCPVVRFESLRSVIAVAVQNDMHLHQMDFTAAFLNGDLSEEVYMKQPTGFIREGEEHLVCKLKRSLYGLKQSPRCWNSMLDKELKKMGFIQSTGDPCIYTKRSGGETLIIGVYVDDIILAGKDLKQIEKIKETLAKSFDVKDLGELKYFLGVNVKIDRSNQTVWIGQPSYTENILKKFNMENAKPISTPVDTGTKLTKATEASDLVDSATYQSAVGGLLYLSTKTRPDITYAVNNVAKFCSNPTKEHWTATKRIFRYLRGTTNHGLLYTKVDSSALIGYSDADWGGDPDDLKSTSGYCFEIGGTLVSWRSKKQSNVALSTAEAEYMALSHTAQEAVWLRELYRDLTGTTDNPTIIHEDNQAAIKMSKNPQYHGRAKHISIKYHFIREQVTNNIIELKYCPLEDMKADMLTKGLNKTKTIKFRNLAGMKDIPIYK